MSAPGWYPDVNDRRLVRYWDGYQWTPQTQTVQRPTGSTVGVVGLLLAIAGAACVLIALTAVDWLHYSPIDGNTTVHFGRAEFASDGSVPSYTAAYSSWLCWLLLVLAAAGAVGAAVPSPARKSLQIGGAIIGFAAAGATLGVIIELGNQINGLGDVISAGPFLAIAGFGLMAAAAAAGTVGAKSQ